MLRAYYVYSNEASTTYDILEFNRNPEAMVTMTHHAQKTCSVLRSSSSLSTSSFLAVAVLLAEQLRTICCSHDDAKERQLFFAVICFGCRCVRDSKSSSPSKWRTNRRRMTVTAAGNRTGIEAAGETKGGREGVREGGRMESGGE